MKRTGFTIMELLVALAIISVLAAILIPVLAKVHATANQGSDISNERQLGLAINEYVQDNSNTYPMLAQYSAIDFGASAYPWIQTIQPYVRSLGIFASPDDPVALLPAPFPGGNYISYAINGIAVNLASGDDHLRGVCGFDNSWYGGGNCSPTDPSACGTDLNAQRASTIPGPAQTILLTNCFSGDADNSLGIGYNGTGLPLSTGFLGGGNGNPAPDNMGAGDFAASQEYPSGLETGTGSNCQPYRGNNSAPYVNQTTADYLFVDGHVASMVPLTTDPNPVTKPAENLWVVHRPDNDNLPVNWAE